MSIAMTVAPEQVEQVRAKVQPAVFYPETPENQVDAAPKTFDTGDTEFRCSLNGNGRLRLDGLSQADRHLGVAVHLSPFVAFFFPLAIFAPLVLWLVRKDRSTFLDDHGREMVNVLITALLIFVAGFFTLSLAWFVGVIWSIVICINMIRGAVAASHGEYFRYPMTFRFLS